MVADDKLIFILNKIVNRYGYKYVFNTRKTVVAIDQRTKLSFYHFKINPFNSTHPNSASCQVGSGLGTTQTRTPYGTTFGPKSDPIMNGSGARIYSMYPSG